MDILIIISQFVWEALFLAEKLLGWPGREYGGLAVQFQKIYML